MLINWGSIVPLLGGMSLGNYNAIKEYYGMHSTPTVFYSYKAFAKNDANCTNYFNNTLGYNDIPYIVLDETDEPFLYNLDFISAVPPCAGLSQLNCGGQKRTEMGRGSCAVQNEWMYKTTEFALGKLKPKVLMGENAPGLFTPLGEGVRHNLVAIAEKHGYSVTFYKTDTILHGVPQSRTRTFYFFWKSEFAPIMNWYKRDYKIMYDYINEIPKDSVHYDEYFNKLALTQVDEYDWIKEKYGENWRGGISDSKTVFQHATRNNLFPEMLEWAKKNERPNLVRVATRLMGKLADGKGFWDTSPLPVYDKINAVIGRNLINTVHPKEERWFNVREYMYMMGLPNDFELVDHKAVNHIAQNVPVNTAKDVTLEVLKFLEGKLELSDKKVLMQDNVKQNFREYKSQ